MILLSSVAHSILVGTVNDVAEGGCECAVELYFTLVFIATRLIQIIVNEALHGVDVDDVARDHVSRVREDLGCQGQVQVLAEIVHFEKQLPVYRVRFLEVVELRFVVPIVIYLLQLVELCLNELVPDFSQGRKVRYLFLEHDDNHSPLRGTNFGSALLPIIQAEILQIFLRVKEQAAIPELHVIVGLMASVSVGSLARIGERSPDFRYFFRVMILNLKRFKLHSSF